MKKHIVVIMAMLLVLSAIFSGCTKGVSEEKEEKKVETNQEASDTKSTEVAKETTYPKDGKMPLVEEKITLTGIIPSTGWIPDIETNKLMNLIEDRTNVHMEWTETSKEQFKEKLSIMISANECPDIVFDDGLLSKQDYEKYGKAGTFADLSNHYNNDAYYLKKVLEDKPEGEQYVTASNGAKYFLPTFGGAYHMTISNKYWINKVWLDNLGLDLPGTPEEFADVLRAFKEKDPNKNGIADEIAMTGSLRAFEDSASFLISAFIPAGGRDNSGDQAENNYVFIQDDKVTFSGDKDEFREGLRFVNSLYEEGLIDPAAFTQNRDQVKPLVEGEYNRIGGMTSHHPGNFASLSDMENGRFHDYVALPPLKGPKGFSSAPWNYSSGMKQGMAISAKCEYPEIAFMWGDYFYKEEISILGAKGFEGEHWQTPPDGAIGLNGEPAKFGESVGQTLHEMNAILGYLGPKNTTGFNERNIRPDGFSYEAMLFDATKDIMEPHKVKRYPYELMSMEEEDINKFTELRITIHGYVTESADRFIVGDLDIDKDWDGYIEQLNDLGLEEFMSLLIKYY